MIALRAQRLSGPPNSPLHAQTFLIRSAGGHRHIFPFLFFVRHTRPARRARGRSRSASNIYYYYTKKIRRAAYFPPRHEHDMNMSLSHIISESTHQYAAPGDMQHRHRPDATPKEYTCDTRYTVHSSAIVAVASQLASLVAGQGGPARAPEQQPRTHTHTRSTHTSRA